MNPPDDAPIHVLFVLLPDSLVLDWAGPAEALRMANQQLEAAGQPPRFVLRFVGPRGDSASPLGLQLTGLEPLPARLPAPCWVVVSGQPGAETRTDSAEAQAALHWLRGLRLKSGELELVSICGGAVLAARAGLLAGRQVTTHHQHLDELQAAEPACRVEANRVFVEDPPIYSSAGVTTGVDLALHRLAALCGPALAARVAQTLVVPLRRGPRDPALSPFMTYRHHLHPALHRVQDAVSAQPQAAWTVSRMAEVGHTSARHLTRLFLAHAGIAPLQYLRRIRLATAQAALQSGLNVTQAAAMAGFSSDTQLRRAWHRFGPAGKPSASVALLQNH
ncbi:MAG: helix-turn-helix domain-containing protein [Ramlibacter sp.]|nr:helix-turn-helix domain-containing protein [Ramlibacter sp.]